MLHITSLIDIWPTQLAVLMILAPLLASSFKNKFNLCLIAFSVAIYIVPLLFPIRAQSPLVIGINYGFLLILVIFWYWWLVKILQALRK